MADKRAGGHKITKWPYSNTVDTVDDDDGDDDYPHHHHNDDDDDDDDDDDNVLAYGQNVSSKRVNTCQRMDVFCCVLTRFSMLRRQL